MTTTARQLAQQGTGWAVASPHSAASSAAAEAFRRGGNAVDAALAAAAMLTVVYPNQCSVGGDLVALVGTPDGGVHAVNASGRAPAAVNASAVAAEQRFMPVVGALPVTVPGVVSGWQTLCDRWGRAPLAHAVSAAHAAAREGIEVAPNLARDLAREQAKVYADPGLREVFAPDGDVLRVGATVRQPRLADSLNLLATHGAAVMYDGEIGQAIVDELRARGSAMTMGDFAEHRVEIGHTASVTFAGLEYVSTTANTQGLFYLEGLRALEFLRAENGEVNPLGQAAGRVAAVLALAAADRDRLLGDPGPSPDVVEELLSERRARSLARSAAPGRVAAPSTANGDTVAVTAADADGLWVSLIQSVFHCLGSGILEPRSGILLHNRGASFSLQPGAPNRLAGGRRPPHTLMPVLTRRDGRLVGSHGAMGGRAQPQTHTHLALQLAGGAAARLAVSAPRWVLGAMEAGGPPAQALSAKVEADVPESAARAIADVGLTVERVARHDDAAGHAHLVRAETAVDGATVFECATDPRADGAALVGNPW